MKISIFGIIMMFCLPNFYGQKISATPIHKTVQQTLRNTFSAILSGDREPKYTAQYPDTPQNRIFLITEICRLYSAFFSDEMHSENMYDILQQQGMWIQKRHSFDPIPTFTQTLLFADALENILKRIIAEPDGKKILVHLGYDYGPNSVPLEFAFKEAGLNNDFYYLLPYKSHTHIRIDQGVISLNLNLAGPPF
ncbi:MAG: hypothetical protein K9M07_04425 [Simkaniaceae bacterium]|nr:hypothetical protein [Simkaniaceae bacterium]